MSTKLVGFSCKSNVYTLSAFFFFFFFFAKCHTLRAKTNSVRNPQMQVFLKIVKERLTVDKSNVVIDDKTKSFRKKWTWLKSLFLLD